jgi:glycosyltransferase involved in cell wall biosynthesis
MQVLQVIGDGKPGGGSTMVLSLARGLAQQGVSVAIASQNDSYIIHEASKSHIPVLELDFSKRRGTAGVTLALQHHLRASPPTIVHAHGARAGLPVAMLPRSSRVAMAYTVHGFHYRHKAAVVRHLAKAAERFCIRRAFAAVFVSANDARIAEEDGLTGGGNRWQIIRNGCPAAQPGRTPASCQFDIVYLGRLVAMKNVGILPRILLALRPARPTLCVIGGGECEAELRRCVIDAGLAAQVTFLGAQPHTSALSYLSRARVMVLPSRWEGLPMSVLEAMHRGIPVVASNVGGTNELVVDGHTGYLVETDDVAAYAARIKPLLADENLRHAMGERARARARAEFSVERQVAVYGDLYSRLSDAYAWGSLAGAAT